MDKDRINIETEKLRGDINSHKLDRISKWSNNFSAIILVILFSLFVYGSIKFNNLTKDINSLEKIKQVETIKLQSLKFENTSLENKKRQLEEELMTRYGLSIDSIMSLSTNEVLEKSLSANAAIKLIISNYNPNGNVIVSYYDRTIDEKRVALELQALGYQFVKKSSSDYMKKNATNSIWFGSMVPIQDVKIVAFALIRAGVPLKGIRPYPSSKENPGYKRNIIEVGASIDLKDKPLLSVDYIKNAKDFKR
jgi:hypothetical protein